MTRELEKKVAELGLHLVTSRRDMRGAEIIYFDGEKVSLKTASELENENKKTTIWACGLDEEFVEKAVEEFIAEYENRTETFEVGEIATEIETGEIATADTATAATFITDFVAVDISAVNNFTFKAFNKKISTANFNKKISTANFNEKISTFNKKISTANFNKKNICSQAAALRKWRIEVAGDKFKN